MRKRRQAIQIGVTYKIAAEIDLSRIESFLSQKKIDSLFTPPLSHPTRGITIADRVLKKFNTGVWIIAELHQKVIGTLAVVPTHLPKHPPRKKPHKDIHISYGVSFTQQFSAMELSTIVTDPKKRERIKGMGTDMLKIAKKYIETCGDNEVYFITDSWVGGVMDQFIRKVNNLEHHDLIQSGELEYHTTHQIDYLIRIFSDPNKRGKDGPPTAIYLIPYKSTHWGLLKENHRKILKLRKLYKSLATTQ
ncbi:MAG: hypothetical protein KBC17_03825 [Candidatus Pacebacteria bacterium]|nr:hypothetical protein [Candidatus Paceibacterota bacterium]